MEYLLSCWSPLCCKKLGTCSGRKNLIHFMLYDKKTLVDTQWDNSIASLKQIKGNIFSHKSHNYRWPKYKQGQKWILQYESINMDLIWVQIQTWSQEILLLWISGSGSSRYIREKSLFLMLCPFTFTYEFMISENNQAVTTKFVTLSCNTMYFLHDTGPV